MKFRNKLIITACTVSAVLGISSCSEPDYPSSKEVVPGANAEITLTDYSSYNISASSVSTNFMRGVDVSEIKGLEECGQKWYDENNVEKDPFVILAENGVNWVRLRIWNDYTQSLADEWGPYGWNNLNRTLNMAKRAKKAGLKILLDFHYSDTWADPSNQKCPAMWADITDKDELAVAVGLYTEEILLAMKSEKCAPDMVQLGNEMQGGLFSSGSSVTNAKNFTVDYLKAAAVAVRKVLPSCKMMLHMSNGGKSSYGDSMLTYASGVGKDESGTAYISLIGVSYYTWYKSHGTDDQLKANLEKFKNAGYGVVIAENSFAYSNDAWSDSTNNSYYQSSTPNGETECCGVQTAVNLTGYSKGTGFTVTDGKNQIDSSIENQAGIIQYLMELCSSVDENGGYFYWGGCYLGKGAMASAWENQALFDIDGKVLPSIKTFNIK